MPSTKELMASIESGEWKTTFFSEKHISVNDLFEDENRVRSSPIFPYGGFNPNLDTISLCHDCLFIAAEEIAEWIDMKKRHLFRKVFTYDHEIGYVIRERNGEKTPSSSLVLALRHDSDCKYGFFITTFNVVEDEQAARLAVSGN
ncbi:MAG: hypothetical protein IKL44_05350 [Clostridia bacterium]|nr:hypothetical protein [Clostridia bacterium]